MTVSTKHFWGKKTFAREKSTLWNKLAMKIKLWHTLRLLWLTPGAQVQHLAHQPVFAAFSSVCPVYLTDELVLVKTYGFIIWSWSKQWEILLFSLWWSVNFACDDLNCSFWGGLKLRKLVINDWVYVFPRVVSGEGGRVVGRWNDMYLLFGGFLLRVSNAVN